MLGHERTLSGCVGHRLFAPVLTYGEERVFQGENSTLSASEEKLKGERYTKQKAD